MTPAAQKYKKRRHGNLLEADRVILLTTTARESAWWAEKGLEACVRGTSGRGLLRDWGGASSRSLRDLGGAGGRALLRSFGGRGLLRHFSAAAACFEISEAEARLDASKAEAGVEAWLTCLGRTQGGRGLLMNLGGASGRGLLS